MINKWGGCGSGPGTGETWRTPATGNVLSAQTGSDRERKSMSLLYAHLTSWNLRGRLSSTAEKDSFLLVRGKVAAGRHRGPLLPLLPPLGGCDPETRSPPAPLCSHVTWQRDGTHYAQNLCFSRRFYDTQIMEAFKMTFHQRCKP